MCFKATRLWPGPLNWKPTPRLLELWWFKYVDRTLRGTPIQTKAVEVDLFTMLAINKEYGALVHK